MSLIDRIIQVNVSRVRDTTPQVGYGIPFFLGESLTTFPETVKSYRSLGEVLVDFADTTPEYLAARAVFGQSPRTDSFVIGQVLDAGSYLAGYNACLQAAVAEGIDFYGVAIASTDAADILAVAAQVETERRIFAVGTDQAAILSGTTGNLFETLFGLGYERTFGIWGENYATQLSNMALLSKQMSKVPGSTNWAYQTLAGVTGDSLFEAEELNLEGYNGIYYRQFASQDVTIGGQMFSGEWIDAIHGIDWMTTSIEVSLAGLLQNVEKIPYTDRGDGLIRTALTAVLETAVDNEVINSDYEITFSDIDSVPLSQRTARIRDGIEINATLSGAINKIRINFVISD